MIGVVSLVSLLALGSTLTLEAIPGTHPPPVLTQEGFNLDRFMGKWFEVAVVSTCPHFMQRRRGNPVVVALELQHLPSEDNFTITATSHRNGSCKHTSTVYSLTSTPGRFFHHVARFGADVDSFVILTNHEEHAIVLQLSTEKPSGNQTTIAKLYSRDLNVEADVLDNFKTLVRLHGMRDENIIMNHNRGECVPGEQVTSQPQTLVPEEAKRNVALTQVPAH